MTPQDSNELCLTEACLTKAGIYVSADYFREGYDATRQCYVLTKAPSVKVDFDVSTQSLALSIPQKGLVKIPENVDWDYGTSAFRVNYNANANTGRNNTSAFGSADLKANIGRWVVSSSATASGGDSGDNSTTINMFTATRAIRALSADLAVGKTSTGDSLLGNTGTYGVSLSRNNSMKPGNLGYTPVFSGIANGPSRVTLTQNGRLLHSEMVPAGPFTIQDLDSSVRGRLDVEVIEQDGRKKTFQVDTAYVPYLTRPGQIRYKLVSGRSRNYEHTTEGPVFAAGEASWGISNKWSLYGGGIVAGDYNALAVGLGRDLNEFGTVSADVTQSVARIPGEETKQGKSWRLSYSKRFDDVNADITFAGYRFSERNYMTMDQYLNARYRNDFTGREKELYTVTLNKNFEDWKTSVNLQYSHQTYWDRRTSDYYTLSVNRYFDAFGFKNISLGLSASRSKYQNRDNDSAFVRLSVPWGTGTASYSGSMSNDRYTNTVGYSDTLNKGLSSYSLNAGVSSGGGQPSQSQMSAYYNHSSPLANLSANFSAVENGYTSFGMSASGGATITAKGAALHAGGMNGGTRLLVDTDGVGGVPVDGGRVSTNRWGIGVVTDVSSYYRNTTSVDLNKLPEDMEATRSVVESVLTEGAIGYREFEVLKGSRLFAVLRLADNSHPPFGASVTNAKGRELGMVADSGLAWLSGVNPGETLNVGWDGRTQCVVDIPKNLDPAQQLLLPCRKAN